MKERCSFELHRNEVDHHRKLDIWLVRALVHNGLAIYATWLYLASILNLTIWISQIYDRKPQSITDASTAAISLVLIGIIVYFICENFIFYSAMAYTLTPWFVLIFALCGILSKQSQSTIKVSDRNRQFTIALLILCGVLVVVRIILLIIRYIRKQVPTLDKP